MTYFAMKLTASKNARLMRPTFVFNVYNACVGLLIKKFLM